MGDVAGSLGPFRIIGIAATVVGLSLAAPGESLGAMYLRMSLTPASPMVGEPAHLAIQTGAVQATPGVRCLADPGASFSAMRSEDWYTTAGRGLKADELAAVAIGPQSQRIEIAPSTRASDTSFWDADLTFTAPGEWIVRMTRPEWSDEDCAGARLRVSVRDATGSSTTLPNLGIGLLAAGGLAVIAVAVARRLRRSALS